MRGESFGTIPENAIRVPIIREESANYRPSEVTGKPDAIEGIFALGRELHKVGAPLVERGLTKLGLQRHREIVAVGETDPEKLDMAAIEHLDSGVEEVLRGYEAMQADEAALDGRTVGRDAIIAELENAIND